MHVVSLAHGAHVRHVVQRTRTRDMAADRQRREREARAGRRESRVGGDHAAAAGVRRQASGVRLGMMHPVKARCT